jgi:sugar lactone lactonase YvrE
MALVFGCHGLAPQAQAQTATRLSQVSIGSGLSQPNGVAVDADGNLYVADYDNDAIEKFTYSSGGYTGPVLIGSDFSTPSGVAVDVYGDVIVADSGHSLVKVMTYSNGSYGTPIPIGGGIFLNPTGVAVDPAANVFASDSTNSAVYEIYYSGGNYSGAISIGGGSFSEAAGVAVDANYNVYAAVLGSGTVVEIPASGGYTGLGAYSYATTIGSGFSDPSGVAVDARGNVYVTDYGHSEVKELAYSSGSYSAAAVLGSGFSEPQGIAVDSSGNVYVSDRNHAYLTEIFATQFSSTSVGVTSAQTLTVDFDFASSGKLASYAVLTQGVAGLDFADATTGTCVAGTTYNAGDTCTVNVRFTPTEPGSRYGAVVLKNSSGAPFATAYISGTGSGPLLGYEPSTRSTVTSGVIASPEGMGVDGSGNLYVAAGDKVYEAAYSAGSYSAATAIFSGSILGQTLNSVQWVTIDGAGDLYIGDGGNGRILKETYTAGIWSATQVCSSCEANEVAVDGSGNVYTLSQGLGKLIKETLNADGTYTESDLTSGNDGNNPWSVVVDSSGNVFYSDQGSGCLYELPYSGGSYGSRSTIDCTLNSPQGMAIDSLGDLYLTQTSGEVVEYTLSGGSYTRASSYLVTGLNNSTGIWVDSTKNLYVSDTGDGIVYKYDYSDAPSFSFATTQIGSTSSDSPHTVTLVNNGNATLTFASPSSGENPSASANFALGGASTCPFATPEYSNTLAAGDSCILDVDFKPEAPGSLTGSVTLIDNAPGSPQSLTLSGTGTQATQTITFSNPGTQTYGTPLTLSATATSGLEVSFASATTAICTVSGTTATFVAPGTCTIDANQAGNTDYAAATQVAQSFTVGQAAQTITFSNPGTQTYGTPLTLSATATSGLAVSFASATTAICTVSGTTATFVAPGTCTIDANQAGNADYAAANQVARSFAVGQATQSITFTNPGTQTYGTPLTLSATATSGLAVSFASATTAVCTVSGTTATFVAPGTCTIDANQAGNADYAAATQVARSFAVGQATQSITFTNPGTQTYGTPLTLSATATSGLTVSFASATTTVCTVSGTTATFVAAGTCTIDANQAGNADYAAANQIAQSFAVGQASQTITFVAPGSPVTYGASPISLVATGGGSGNSIVFSSLTPTVCTVSGATATFVAVGTCTLAANQAGNTDYSAASQVTRSIVVNQATQTITFPNPGTQTYGTPLTLSAKDSAGLTISFSTSTPSVCSVLEMAGIGPEVSFASSGICSVTASQAGNSNYDAATSVTQSFTVNTEAQTIAFANPGPQAVGVGLTLAATASSGLAVVYSSSTAAICAVSGSAASFLAPGTCTITAAQAGSSQWSAASATQSFAVTGGPQTITFAPIASPVTFGVAPIALSATASSGLAVSFSVVSGPATITGSSLNIVGAGTVVVAASQAGNQTWLAATSVNQTIVVNQATPTIAWPSPAPVVYGTALSGKQLDATASVPGSLAYSPSAGATPAVGVDLLTVTFTPTDTADYKSATASASLTVTPATPKIALATSTNPQYVTDAVVFTAALTSAAGAQPSGAVSFLDGDTVLGSATIAAGVASFTTTSLAIGPHTITAVYSGDANYLPVTSAALTQVIQDFNLTLSTPTGGSPTNSVQPGGTATYSLVFNPVNGSVFAQPVSLAVAGLPPGATATFTPNVIPANSGSANVTLTVSLAAVTGQLRSVDRLRPLDQLRPLDRSRAKPLSWALALVLLPFFARARRVARLLGKAGAGRWAALLVFAVVGMGALLGIAGCGAKSSGFFGQPPQTYVLTITGTSGALSHSTTVTLTVE